ncbi:hypothetical protein Tco_0281543 [Tanacetum coccineum]
MFHGRCTTFEEMAALKEHFDFEKIPGYRSSSKKRFNQAGDDLATTFYPFISEATAHVPLWKSFSRRSQSLSIQSLLYHILNLHLRRFQLVEGFGLKQCFSVKFDGLCRPSYEQLCQSL